MPIENFSLAAIKSHIRNYVWKTPVLTPFYIEHLIDLQINKLNQQITSPAWTNTNFFAVGSLLNQLAKRKRNNICHIIASGWSAAGSINKIDIDHDYIMGFNFAAIFDLPFDSYFF